jgi:hypothetical protein
VVHVAADSSLYVLGIEKLPVFAIIGSMSHTGHRSKRRRVYHPACARLRKLISPYDHGRKHEGRVVHAHTNAQVLHDLNTRGWVYRPTNATMVRHFEGEETVYFTADGRLKTPEVLLMVDVDCHKKGTIASAIAFAEHLRDHHFPGLYFEPSTNGNGVHAYLVLDKQGFGDERTHQLFGMLDKALKGVHAAWQAQNPKLEVELVEVKGHPPRLDWSRHGKVDSFTAGQLAKLPREINRRWDEFLGTPKINSLHVSELYRKWRVEDRAEVKQEAGSISGHVVGREALDRFDAYLSLAAKLMPVPHRTSGREVATAEDLAILLLILEACTGRMNADGSMPTARIRENWGALYEQGEVDRPFNPKRYACLRDFLSREKLLDWEDEAYLPFHLSASGKGQAAKWRASEQLLEMLENSRQEAAPSAETRDTGDKDHLYGACDVLDHPGVVKDTSVEGNCARWLRELSLIRYPRPVLRVPFRLRWAA